VDFVYRTGTGVYFRESGARLFESAGFACLDRPPQARVVEGRAYTLIGGCWYTWTRSTVDDD
jgi:hypothetical protein